MELAIINTILITFRKKRLGIIQDGAVGIKENKIDFVGKTSELRTGDADEVIDGSGCVTMPGLVDAHAHTGLALLKGAAQDMPEIQWMKEGLAPFVHHMDEGDMVAGSKLGVIEGIRAGTTTFCEYARNVGTYVERIYSPFNVRVVAVETLNEVVYGKSGERSLYEFDSSKGDVCLKKANKLVDTYLKDEMVKPCYGPQAMDMVSTDLLKEVKHRSQEDHVDIHMHVAQGEREHIQVSDRYGESTVNTLSKLDVLDERLVAIHCHDTSQEEKETMVNKGVRMVGCPSSIAMIDGIVPPVHDFLVLGTSVGLGTDQAPGPGGHNMFKEMRTASILTKIRDRDPTRIPSWEALRLGTQGGSEALGMDHQIGTLEVGKAADIITVDLRKTNLIPYVSVPFHNFIPNLIHSSAGGEVKDVIINGRPIMKNGCFTEIDEHKIIREGQKRGVKLFKKAADNWRETGNYMVKKVEKGLF
ncbi:MAG: amidohydrolase family protein [Thermoplasmata archaeon]